MPVFSQDADGGPRQWRAASDPYLIGVLRHPPSQTGPRRDLTPGERAALSPGLWEALESAGASPRIVARVHWMARVCRLWRGHTPILTLYERIYWPGAPADLSELPQHMSILQHELQHVLEFATGRLSLTGYAADPRNWRYGYELAPDRPFESYGAEQRASIAEDLWRIERGLWGEASDLERYRKLIPWAR